MAKTRFSYSSDNLREIARDALKLARAQGASDCEVEVSEGYGQSVTVRKGEVENIEYNRDKGLGVTVYSGQKKGYASSSDLTPQAVRDSVDKALTIARFTASDEAAGLADRDLIVRESAIHDLDLYHPWDLSVEKAIVLAQECEAAAFRLDKRISNSEGASVSCQAGQFVSANSAGFMGGFSSTRQSMYCAVIAEQSGKMQRDDWYVQARSERDLPKPSAVGDYAGRRALARLKSRKIGTRQAPVLFEAPVAGGLIGHFVGAVSGGNLYRKSTFLNDSLGKRVFSDIVSLREEPHLKKALSSSYFDDDGVATHARDVVSKGVVGGYFLSTYSARKLGMRTTANAGGNHNLILAPGTLDLDGMLREMGTGLLVTEVMGQGVNTVTGDYSRGAAGYWVEGGKIAYPVEEITIAGNLRDMFLDIAAIGSDVLVRGSRSTGSMLVGNMTIAGN
jgi:PmbA protein